MRRFGIVLLGLNASATTILYAHSGHGVPGEGKTLRHYLTEPLHVFGWAGLIFVLFLAGSWVRSRSARRVPLSKTH